MVRPVILDCDPGHDDAIALMLALACPELDVLTVTTCAGNQTADKTLNNALRILTLLGRKNIPVAGGASQPLLRKLVTAEKVHGKSGLDGPDLPDPDFASQELGAVELMAGKVRSSSARVTLVATGPLTNIALFLSGWPQLHEHIERIVLMGGSSGSGNWTPAAEFNIYVDPEAADIVFRSGIPITMCGLDVTHQAQVLEQDIVRIRNLGNPVSEKVAGLLDFYMIYHRNPVWGFIGAPLHDPCTIAWLVNPQLFATISCWVGIETQGSLTRGMTVVDRYHCTGHEENTAVVTGVDRKGFIDFLVERLAVYGD